MRVAVVTGAARGIGAAAVHALCRQGYFVLALDSVEGTTSRPGVEYPLATMSDLEEVAAAWPQTVLARQVDVSDEAQVGQAVGEVVSQFGGIDVAVCVAGILIGGQPVWETPTTHLRSALEVNTIGVWNVARATIPHMLVSEDPASCRFVAVASAGADRGLFHLGAYTVSKHAVVGAIHALAADLVGTGVTAVAVSPGATRGAILDATANVYGVRDEDLTQHQGIRRLIEPNEIADVIVWCCSSSGAILNGSVVSAGGGFAG